MARTRQPRRSKVARSGRNKIAKAAEHELAGTYETPGAVARGSSNTTVARRALNGRSRSRSRSKSKKKNKKRGSNKGKRKGKRKRKGAPPRVEEDDVRFLVEDSDEVQSDGSPEDEIGRIQRLMLQLRDAGSERAKLKRRRVETAIAHAKTAIRSQLGKQCQGMLDEYAKVEEERNAAVQEARARMNKGLKRMFSAQQRFSRHIHKYAADCATINAKVARVLRASGHDDTLRDDILRELHERGEAIAMACATALQRVQAKLHGASSHALPA